MGTLRTAFGAVAGATVAGLAWRTRKLARERDASMGAVLGDLPETLQHDALRIADAAREALHDGRRAARRKEAEIDKVLTQSRQTEGAS